MAKTAFKLVPDADYLSESANHHQVLRESEDRFRDLFVHLPLAYQSLDAEGIWLDANQEMAELMGFSNPEAMLGQNFVDFWDPEIRDQFDASYEKFKQANQIRGELKLIRRDGEALSVMVSGRIQRDAQGAFLRTHCMLMDVTQQRTMERSILRLNQELEGKVRQRTQELSVANERLHKAARMDALTGLPNRLALNERLRAEFSHMQRSNKAYSFLMIDVDHFKRVNDYFGHDVGDDVLQHLAEVMRQTTRKGEQIFRFGGEEFVAILAETGLAGATSFAARLRQAILDQPHPDAGRITVSIGLAEAKTTDSSEMDVIQTADRRLNTAKDLGRNRVVFD